MSDFIKTELRLNASLKNFPLKESASPSAPKGKQSAKDLIRAYFTAFFAVFLAELGDKTQLATLLMAAESKSPWIVFIGAASALVLVSLVGVILGQWLATRLSPDLLKTAAGASLLLISILLLWDIVHL